MLKIFLFLLILLTSLFSPNNAYAKIELKEHIPDRIYANSGQIKFTFTSDSNDFTGDKYTFGAWRPDNTSESYNDAVIIHENIKPTDKTSLEAIIPIRQTPFVKTQGTWRYKLWLGDRFNLGRAQNNIVYQGTFEVFAPQAINPQTGQSAGLPAIRVDTTIWKAGENQNVYIVNAQPEQDYILWFNNDPTWLWKNKFTAAKIGGNKYNDENSATAVIEGGKIKVSDSLKTLCMTQSDTTFLSSILTLTLSCDFRITGINIVAVLPKTLPPSVISNQVGIPSTSTPPQIPTVCPNDTCDTALGPIMTKPAQFIKSIFTILLSFAGAIAVILIIVSGYRYMTSQGNPEKVQEAREQLTSAIVGLLFIIFSFSILTIIGVDILHIPGFER